MTRASLWASLYMWLAVIVLLLVTMIAAAQERTMCQAEPVGAPKVWWSWRTVEGRQCWYDGPRGKSKDELYWPKEVMPPVPRTEDIDMPPASVNRENTGAGQRWEQEHRWWEGK